MVDVFDKADQADQNMKIVSPAEKMSDEFGSKRAKRKKNAGKAAPPFSREF